MMRQTPWRRGPSDAVSWHLDQAAQATIYIVRENGPTGFLLRDDEETKPFKVLLGDPHTCSCPSFLREKEPCKHICWLLLRRFKLPRDHEYTCQAGLVEREINSILRGLHSTAPAARKPQTSAAAEQAKGRQKELDSEDVCPICQDELLRRRLPVTYCRTCGNPVHLNCMKIWAEHQPKSETGCTLKCPLCREDFASLQILKEELRNSGQLVTASEKEKPERHLGIPCNSCRTLPIEGACYKCTECTHFHLCQGCFTVGHHPPHQFVSRQKRNQRWRPLVHVIGPSPEHGACLGEERNSQEGTWNVKAGSCHVPKQVLKSFPLTLVRQSSKLLGPGQQCRMCLKAFSIGQYARLLPCRHTFHRDCIDKWLLHEDACPVDKHVLYNPLTWKETSANENANVSDPQLSSNRLANLKETALFIPGTGLFSKQTNHGYASELSQIKGKPIHHENAQVAFKHTLASNALDCQCFTKQTSSKLHRISETTGPRPSNLFQGLAIETTKKPCSCKSLDRIAARKGIFPKRIRGSSSAHQNVFPLGRYVGIVGPEGDHGGLDRAAGSQGRHDSKSAGTLGVHGELNLRPLLGTPDVTMKGDPELVHKYQARQRLLSRRPKQIPVSLQTSDMAFLMEGIPLNHA
ncbi:E3 ubiquitin-protein ligase ZSWIM2 [Ambystoma mexicanum]|uniref:E3 ubiquitin-protein ligase ZSWIM2 n=1 Tax=Ambystoma mexicanum TaxID=8296 RepID=UPI0037E97341